ncbi:MAG TPA: GGDEF domain-containing protein [Thermoleophilaceae bacterium]|nr:GGDEF domain-containing protein [Thermoleophilaceae bacterium]
MSSGQWPPPGVEPTGPEKDQIASDADQIASDRDRAVADDDRSQSVSDQAQSDRDQRASNRDQRAADRELQHGHVRREVHQASSQEREEATGERDASTAARAEAADKRADNAAQREAAARLRELTADSRDRAAEARDEAAAILDEQFDNGSGSTRAVREYLLELRERAAGDRMLAASDRRQAREDRERAAEDRVRAAAELQRAHLDDLTGVYRRDSGTTAMQREINRAHHADGMLVLAFVDVDGLKQVNDGQGHSAGDALLREVVDALRSGLRSYDPIVRLGGDEFVCALAGATLEEAERRMKEICEEIELRGGSISVGLSELRKSDTLATLMERGDAELYRVKGRKHRQPAEARARLR